MSSFVFDSINHDAGTILVPMFCMFFLSTFAALSIYNLFMYLLSLIRQPKPATPKLSLEESSFSGMTKNLSSKGNNVRLDDDSPREDNIKRFIDSRRGLSFDEEVTAFETRNNTKLLFICSPELTIQDAEEVTTAFRTRIDSEIDVSVILDTRGGSIAAAEIIQKCFENHNGDVDIYVPQKACSAGTMIALSGDNLFLGRNAYLTPFDPQISGLGVKHILNCLPSESYDGFMAPVYNYIRSACQRAMNRTNLFLKNCDFDDKVHSGISDMLITGEAAHNKPFFHSDLVKVAEYFQNHSAIFPNGVYEIFDKFNARKPSDNRGSLATILRMFGM